MTRAGAHWPDGKLAPCGTPAALKRHQRRGEPSCPACLEAERRRQAGRRGLDAGTQSPSLREPRNGLPEFTPYVWKGQPS